MPDRRVSTPYNAARRETHDMAFGIGKESEHQAELGGLRWRYNGPAQGLRFSNFKGRYSRF